MGSSFSGLIGKAVPQRKFWTRYAGDTVGNEHDQVSIFIEHLVAILPDIQFTMEEDETNQQAFLNVRVCRKDSDGLNTGVFNKATNTTQVLSFNSNPPLSQKTQLREEAIPACRDAL
ncbi:hypothetical protein SprV_0902775400 [Sparganum proliferum]